MINKELVINKMADIQKYLEEMAPILKYEAREIIDDNLKLHTVERLFQLIVDAAIDINTHIIIETELNVPDDYQSTFMTLGEHKILAMDFAVAIAPSVGLRNLIIHKYGKVDIKKMVDDIKNNIGQYKEYLENIAEFLKK
ncbi:MAG: HepT-like ribonuclease domain-containing protein [Patescibacteria group bacterium]